MMRAYYSRRPWLLQAALKGALKNPREWAAAGAFAFLILIDNIKVKVVIDMPTAEDGHLLNRGKRLYQTRLKRLLEPEHTGEYVAIEPDSGDYYLGYTMSEAYEKAAAEHPGKKFYLARVGYKAAVSFKHRTSL